jgi:hypothetical protein
VREALAYVLEQARRARTDLSAGETTLIQNKLGHRVHTFFTVTFLSQAYGMQGPWVSQEAKEDLGGVIRRLAERISSTQESDGSWHKQTFGSLKATAMAWLALRSAQSAGIDIEDASVDRVLTFIQAQYNPASGLFDREVGHGNYQTIYATSSALRVLYGMGEGNTPRVRKATETLFRFITQEFQQQFLTVEGEDYLAAAMATQALLHEENGKEWRRWFTFIRQELVRRQGPDGSWTGTACISGRTFATACALLTLQAPYRVLPLQDL